MRKQKGFTMAEILTVLMLIGFVAVLTLPYMINEFNKSRWAVTFKRSFAETFNALQAVALDEDCANSLTCTKIFEGGQPASTKKFGDAFTGVLATSAICGITSGDDCFSHKIRVGLSPNSKLQTVRETLLDIFQFNTEMYTFRTNRGVSYALLSFGLSCLNQKTPENAMYVDAYHNAYVYNYDETKDDPSNQMLSLCGFIVMDVNGPQSPNVWGKDVFGVWITDRSVLGVYPFGGDFDNAFRNKCNVTTEASSQDTRGCAAQLIKDGWKITY